MSEAENHRGCPHCRDARREVMHWKARVRNMLRGMSPIASHCNAVLKENLSLQRENEFLREEIARLGGGNVCSAPIVIK